jgi:predicted signal transduction protein with EAL and GGDEF domain
MNLTFITELIFPLLALGVLTTGLLAFGLLAGGRDDGRMYWAVFVLLVVSILSVGFDLSVLILGGAAENEALAVQLSRLHEVVSTAYVVAIPLFLKSVLPTGLNTYPVVDVIFKAGLVILLAFVAFAFLSDSIFLLTTGQGGTGSINPYSTSAGRVGRGPLFPVRDAMIGLVILACLIIAIDATIRGRLEGSSLVTLSGLILGLAVGVMELYANFAGRFPFPFSVLPLSPVGVASTVFTVLASAAYVLQYGRQSRELERSNRRLEQVAFQSDQTELPNRKALIRDIDRLFDSFATAGAESEEPRNEFLTGAAIPFAEVFLCDLDSFGSVQDSYGSTFSERLLRRVASRLSAELARLPELDASLYHADGDRFAVLIPKYMTERERDELEKGIVEAISTPVEIEEGQEIFLSAGIGHCIFAPEAKDAETVIQRAKFALADPGSYANAVRRYSPRLHAHIEHDQLLVQELRKAVLSESFTLVYQPIVDAAGAVAAVEALVRSPVATPDVFIPLAEKSGLIVPITEMVIRQVAQDLPELIRRYPALSVHLNISARHIASLGFPASLQAHVTSAGLSAQNIGVEITETSLLQDADTISRILGSLREAGFSVSIDDFGTGYASMSYLKQIPAERLKIDGSFVRELPGSSEDVALVESMILLAQQLGKQIVAEGVETTDQRDYLINRGVDFLQGYLFARPMALAQLLTS